MCIHNTAKMSHCKLIVTPQEKDIIFQLRQLDIEFSIEPLVIGDIQIYKNDTPHIIIERKAKTDLKASIHSNRYHDQKYRMLDTGIGRHNIIYLIENQQGDQDNVWSAITNTLYRDQLSVFKTKSVKESALFIRSLFQSVKKHDCFTPSSLKNEEHKEVFIDQKKKEITNDNWFCMALTIIKGVSKNMAKTITDQYKSYNELEKVYIQHGDTVLSDIQIGKRKIGKVVSKRICATLFDQVK